MKTHRLDTLRGELRGMVCTGSELVVLTEHPEGQPTGLYALDPLTAKIRNQAVSGGRGLIHKEEVLAFAGSDGHLYAGVFGSVAALGAAFEPAPRAVAFIAGGFALASGSFVVITAAKGKEKLRFELESAVTAIAADVSGKWLAAGTASGWVHVFSVAEAKAWTALERDQLHGGAVMSMAFEPDELRIRSVGADRKMLLTHARGALEAEDRSKTHGHDAVAVQITEDRAYSVGADGQAKTWIRGSRRAPSTMKDGLGTPVDAALVTIEGLTHLAVASEDQAVRLCPLEEKSAKVLPRTLLFEGSLATARHQLQSKDAQIRQKAVDLVAGWADRHAVDLLARAADRDTDHRIKARAAELLGTLGHARAISPLEKMLAANTEGVRLAAFAGLRRQLGEDALDPLDKAIASHGDVGRLALDALAKLSTSDSRATERLIAALDHKWQALRQHALGLLEGLHPSDATAGLLGLRSKVAHMRWTAALRMHQRDLLGRPEVRRALRAGTGDDDGDVRLLCYQLTVLAHPALTAALRHADADLHRQLHAVEHHGAERPPKLKKAPKAKAAPETLVPLFEASASRRPDICLLGASHLAALGDQRALGVLLQLSRNTTPDVRVRACRSLQRLGDPRGLPRLRSLLHDGQAEVRDAAFSAVAAVLDEGPLGPAALGLSSPLVDVRQRGLKVLSGVLGAKKKPSAAVRASGHELLLRALNDGDRALRAAAFKLVLKVIDPLEDALRFAFGSLRTDIRSDALTEVMGEVRHPWAWDLLLERLDDPGSQVRKAALDFARKKGKGRTPDPLQAALASAFPDMRKAALEVLAAKVRPETLPLLEQALDDAEPSIRTHALEALRRAGALDSLVKALDSSHEDVRIAAATTLAHAGRSEAADAMLAQLVEEEPELKEQAEAWSKRVAVALQGLALLRDPRVVPGAVSLLDHKVGALREWAAYALGWCADAEVLVAHLSHEDKKVSEFMARSLAWLGRAEGASIALSTGSAIERATCAAGLGEYGHLLELADGGDDELGRRILLMWCWADPSFPELLVSALTVESLNTRLSVARVLQAWGGDDLDEVVIGELSARQRGSWEFPAETWRKWALAVRHGDPRERVMAMGVLPELSKRAPWNTRAALEQSAQVEHAFDGVLLRTSIAEIADPGAPEPAGLETLVFGAYVGLSAQAAGRKGRAVRAAALRQLAKLDVESDAVHSVLIPALSDEAYPVRAAAFEGLQAAGVASELLIEEALATGHRDMGVAGLTLMAESGGDPLLAEVAAVRTDGLELVAFERLVESQGAVKAGKAALNAASASLRSGAVVALGKVHESKGALTALKGALKSPHIEVRAAAAAEMSRLKEGAAFDPLVALLRTSRQRGAINWMVGLGDPRTADALLDRLTDDPQGTAEARPLLTAVGGLRDPSVSERLVALVEAKEHLRDAIHALVVISGYDQRLRYDTERPDDNEASLRGQHPRHDALFAQTFELMVRHKQQRLLRGGWVAARWCRGSEMEGTLVRLLHHADEAVRHEAVFALGYRLRHRNGDPKPLLDLLGHKDPVTSFLAAEGLALARNATGLSVLLASAQSLENLQMRHRAVRALGELGDERAVDLLLGIVNDEEHALIESAVEAVGHLSQSGSADAILERLLALSRGEHSTARRAVVGLRWFNTPTAWGRVREVAQGEDFHKQRAAAEQLRHDDSPETRDLLAKLVLDADHWSLAKEFALSLRAVHGEDSREPDYLFLRTRLRGLEDETVQRLRKDGDPARILEALAHPHANPDAVAPLMLGLVARDPLPVEAAVAALKRPEAAAQALGARILGRAKKLKAADKKLLSSTLDALFEAWADRAERAEYDSAESIAWLLWAGSRHGIENGLARALAMEGDGIAPVLDALPKAVSGCTDAKTLQSALQHPSAAVRAAAASSLAASHAKAVGTALRIDDRRASQRLLARGTADLSAGLASVHTQGNALGTAIRAKDVAALSAALASEEELVRMGAVEGLGAMADEAAEKKLVAVATDEAEDETVRRAAWRALRRSKRARAAVGAR